MRYLLDTLYLMLLLVLGPWLLVRAWRTGKSRRGWSSNLFGACSFRSDGDRPVIWFHGVSVGEIHLLAPVLTGFRERHPDWQIVVSATTDTGLAEARRRYPEVAVIPWPLDVGWAVRRALQRVRPCLLVLVEGEWWPNMLAAAERQGVPVLVINGRMSPRSARRYRRVAWLARRLLLDRIARFAMQTTAYAEHLRAIGVAAERIEVTGNIKYDGVLGDRQHSRVRALAERWSIQPGDRVWIVGSTQPPEERLALSVYQALRSMYPTLRLILVPRQKDRFDVVAREIESAGEPLVRHSQLTGPVSDRSAVILVDTIGELGAAWGLAEIALVGGSFDGQRGGQNMIEPAAFGAAVLFGPHTWNFRDTVQRLKEAGAAIEVPDAEALLPTMAELLADDARRKRLGQAAKALVASQQGAAQRTLDVIAAMIEPNVNRRQVA